MRNFKNSVLFLDLMIKWLAVELPYIFIRSDQSFVMVIVNQITR